MAATANTSEVYPPEIQELVKHCKYKDATSFAFAALVIRREKFTGENRVAFEKEISSMKRLHSELVSLRVASDGELKTLTEIEKSSLHQLAKNVPNIEEMPQSFGFTFDQRLTIKSALVRAERHKQISNYDPKTADAVKALFANIEPAELAHIFKVSLSLAEELKENLEITSSDSQEPCRDLMEGMGLAELNKCLGIASKDPQEPSQAPEVPLDLAGKLKESLQMAFQALEDQEATMDPQKSAQIIEDICGKLQSIPPRIKELRELIKCSFRLVQKLGYYISVLESWLKEEKIIRQKGNASNNEKENTMETATKKDRKKENFFNIRRSWKF